MKFLVLLALFSFNSFACLNSLPESEIIKAINLEPNAGSKSCADLPEEKCHCYDGVQWETAELVTEFEQDPETGIIIEKKVLKEVPAKKEAYLAKLEAEKTKQAAKRAAKEALKNVDIDSATTIAKLKAIVKLLLEVRE